MLVIDAFKSCIANGAARDGIFGVRFADRNPRRDFRF
jgi:hypothetical protein